MEVYEGSGRAVSAASAGKVYPGLWDNRQIAVDNTVIAGIAEGVGTTTSRGAAFTVD